MTTKSLGTGGSEQEPGIAALSRCHALNFWNWPGGFTKTEMDTAESLAAFDFASGRDKLSNDLGVGGVKVRFCQ